MTCYPIILSFNSLYFDFRFQISGPDDTIIYVSFSEFTSIISTMSVFFLELFIAFYNVSSMEARFFCLDFLIEIRCWNPLSGMSLIISFTFSLLSEFIRATQNPFEEIDGVFKSFYNLLLPFFFLLAFDLPLTFFSFLSEI